MRFSCDDSSTRAPAAVDLHGLPLFDHPPPLPRSAMYAEGPGVIWWKLPDEDEAAFCARVRASAAACGLEHVTTWRRRDISWR
jgi:hypothetical protein